ncbi:MAG: serine/threonine-protein kinase [Polyangiales bacterium]
MVERIGNCRVLGEIGSGGMAVVYEAIQEPLDRRVAIKALKPAIALDFQFSERFEREARFMASLQHENILHVIDFLKDGDSMYIIMEFVDGIDLYDLLDKTPRLPAEIAAIIALQLARGLNYAHFRGLVHRDIKPANIMLSAQGDVKLMDFGIARHEHFNDLTEQGTGLGTPSYMSPEQILGEKLDFRSDIFSVGIVLYQMLTGTKPFVEDEHRSVMQKIRLDRYESPKKLGVRVPKELDRIMNRCMQKLPANRYATTQGLVEDLNDFVSKRVSINFNARLLMYLRDVGVITQEQADEVFGSVTPQTYDPGRQTRPFLTKVAKSQGAALAAIVVLGAGVQISRGASSHESEQGSAIVDVNEAGFVRVVVDPWADVRIDGVHVATTPHAMPITLSPGIHYFSFVNPYYRTVEKQVLVKKGETEQIDITLVRKVEPEVASP